jgi:hypothetical protein
MWRGTVRKLNETSNGIPRFEKRETWGTRQIPPFGRNDKIVRYSLCRQAVVLFSSPADAFFRVFHNNAGGGEFGAEGVTYFEVARFAG